MKVNLFTTFYLDKNISRQNELDFCIEKNLKVNFSTIFVIVEKETEKDYLKSKFIDDRIKCIILNTRPSFNDFFIAMSFEEYSQDINVLSNTDIFFTDLIPITYYFENVPNSDNHCLALSRWDYYPDGSSVHFDQADSQDTWVFKGTPNVKVELKYTMGIAGCDNRLAHDISQSNYVVLNPSKSIKSYHYHVTNVRNYLDNTGVPKERVPSPYLLVNPE
jgi:hypothetical protein